MVNERLNISPNVQYVKNSSGDEAIDDAVVVGVLVQLVF